MHFFLQIGFIVYNFFNCFRTINSIRFDLPEQNDEIFLLHALSCNVKANVKSSALEITQYDLDLMHQRNVGEKAFSSREYPFAHPINRNY